MLDGDPHLFDFVSRFLLRRAPRNWFFDLSFSPVSNDQTNWSDLKQIQHLKILTLDKQTPDSAIALDFKPTLKAVHYTTKHHTKFSGSNLELTGTNEFISLKNLTKMLRSMDRLVFAWQLIEFQCRDRS